MGTLKERLRTDLTTAMKARDELTSATLRMALSAVTTEEVAGKEARELSDADVLKVLTREVKKRKEASEAFTAGGRPQQAEREAAEGEVLTKYLPAQLTDDELATLVAEAIAETGAEGPKAMGQVMRVLTPKTTGRADGRRVSAAVKAALSS